jgi:hypothetical protein
MNNYKKTKDQAELASRINEAILSGGRGMKSIISVECGCTPQAVTNWCKSGKITKDNLQTVAKLTDYNYLWLLTGQGEKYVNVPIQSLEKTAIISGNINQQTKADAMNPLTIQNLFRLKCKALTWVIYILGNSENPEYVVNQEKALEQSIDMLNSLLVDLRAKKALETEQNQHKTK